jgi:hypothetical protein
VTRDSTFEIDQGGVVFLGLPARYGWRHDLLREGHPGGGDLIRAVDPISRSTSPSALTKKIPGPDGFQIGLPMITAEGDKMQMLLPVWRRNRLGMKN